MWKLVWSSCFLHCVLSNCEKWLHAPPAIALKARTWRFIHDFLFDTILFRKRKKRVAEASRNGWARRSWGKWCERERDKVESQSWKLVTICQWSSLSMDSVEFCSSKWLTEIKEENRSVGGAGHVIWSKCTIEAKTANFLLLSKDCRFSGGRQQRHLEQMQFSRHNEIIALIFPRPRENWPINCNFGKMWSKVLFDDRLMPAHWLERVVTWFGR